MKPRAPTIGSLVWHLANRWKTEVDRAVAPFGLTHAQYSVLATLHEMRAQKLEPTQRELAEQVELTPIFVSKLLRALEGAGLVLRRPDAQDSRAVRLDLTERGSEVAGEARAVVRALDRRLTAPLGTAGGPKARALAETLRALMQAVER